jgi:hypothetical protein
MRGLELMSATLLGFGLFALVAAIAGGGLKAFGFELGVLNSAGRQISLAVVGLILIASAELDKIQSRIFPARIVMETHGPATLEPGQTVKIPLSLTQGGQVEVVIQSLMPDWSGFSGQKGLPGQDAVFVNICAAGSGGPCPNRQMGVADTFSQELPLGSGTISVFNFATSPRLKVTLRVKHPA